MNLHELIAENVRLREENADLAAKISANADGIISILMASLPADVEPATPVPESLARDLAGHRGPRYFADGRDSWIWSCGEMKINGDGESVFKSPEELLQYHDVFETDENGRPLTDSDADAGERGDREYRLRKEEES